MIERRKRRAREIADYARAWEREAGAPPESLYNALDDGGEVMSAAFECGADFRPLLHAALDLAEACLDGAPKAFGEACRLARRGAEDTLDAEDEKRLESLLKSVGSDILWRCSGDQGQERYRRGYVTGAVTFAAQSLWYRDHDVVRVAGYTKGVIGQAETLRIVRARLPWSVAQAGLARRRAHRGAGG